MAQQDKTSSDAGSDCMFYVIFVVDVEVNVVINIKVVMYVDG